MDRITQNPRPAQSSTSHAGFTLIELLVVISIIALLVGILLPALGAARRTAQNSQCLSNIRQMDTAAMSFAADHKFHVQLSSSDRIWLDGGYSSIPSELRGKQAPFSDQSGGNQGRIKDWASAVVSYMGGDPDDDFENADTKVSNAFICPSDAGQEEGEAGYQIYNNITGGQGKEHKPISYGINADITTWNNNGNDSLKSGAWAPGGALTIRPFKGDVTNGSLDAIRTTSSTMLYADCGTARGIGQPLLVSGDQLFYSATFPLTVDPSKEVSGTMGAVYENARGRYRIPLQENETSADADGPADRHSDKVNVAFTDGHAASFGTGDFNQVYLSPHK